MALAEALDVCFGHQYIPHVLDLIYRYAFDIDDEKTMNGIPTDIYLQLIHESTVKSAERQVDDDPDIILYKVHDKLHKLDGPAKTQGDTHKCYFVNNKKHRVDGPAVIYSNGFEEYWVNGNRHRLDGPAVYFPELSNQYWIDGLRYSLSEFDEEIERRRILTNLST